MSEHYTNIVHVQLADSQKRDELKAYLTDTGEYVEYEDDELIDLRDELELGSVHVESLPDDKQLSIAYEEYGKERTDLVEIILERWLAIIVAHHAVSAMDTELIYDDNGELSVVNDEEADEMAKTVFGMDI